MSYRLSKCSSPGFELYTEHLETVLSILEFHVCSCCMEYDEEGATVAKSYNNLTAHEKINEILATSCGVEFSLDEIINKDKYYNIINEYVDFSKFQ